MEHKKDFDHDDPFELKAIEVAGGDPQSQAKIFIEEFLMLDKSKEKLIQMFNDPFFTGMYHLTMILGKETIHQLIDESLKNTYSIRYNVSE